MNARQLFGALVLITGLLSVMLAATTSAQMPRDVLNALPETIEGEVVPVIIRALHELTDDLEFDCDHATVLKVVYRGNQGHVFLVVDEKPCAVVTGPADGVRQLILKARGEPT